MRLSLIAACIILPSFFVLGCGANQSQPASALQAEEPADSENKPARRGLDRMDRFAR
jgi:hypothetical protein